MVTMQQLTQFATLRSYLNANGISQSLSFRIHRSAQGALDDRRKNRPETSVELLKLVSEPLKVELHHEIYSVSLICHPFFYYYDLACQVPMRQICHSAVIRKRLTHGDLLFTSGETPEHPHMFFLVAGELSYTQDNMRERAVHIGSWACEASLWTTWVHHGTM